MNSLYYLIPAVVVIILVFPVFAEVRVSFNPLFNRGVVALFLFRIKVFYFIVSFHGTYVELQNEKETKRQEIEFSSQQFAHVEEFSKQIKDKIRLKKMYVFYNIGTGDAYSSALVCGLVNLVLMHVFLVLKSHKPTASFCVYDTVSYNKTQCEVAGRVAASISFFDVAYSFVLSVILSRRRMKNEKANTSQKM